jgi:hypothetical protein
VPDHAGLRRPGRARGVDEGEEVVLADLRLGLGQGARIRRCVLAPPSAQVVELCERDHVREAEVGDLCALVIVLDEDPDRVRMLQHVAAVARRAVCVDRRPDRADPPQRVVEQRPLEVRLREDPEGVALADSEREQPVGDLLDRLGRLLPGDLLPAVLALDQVRRVLAPRRGRIAPQPPDRPHELSLRWKGSAA